MARKLAANADLEEIAVFAVIVTPLRDLGLVGALHRAAVDLACHPAVTIAAKALAETPGIALLATTPRP